MRPAYIWAPRDTQTRLEAMRELLAKASEENANGGDMGRSRVSAAVAAAVVAAARAARAAYRHAGFVVKRPGWD